MSCFAFPLLGPSGCDAGRDGTLPAMARQAAFYQAHRDLYLRGRFLGADSLRTAATNLSLAVWSADSAHTVVLHVINRAVARGKLQSRRTLAIDVPTDRVPGQAGALSPDWVGERAVACEQREQRLRVTLPELDAYAVILLRFDQRVDLSRLEDPLRVPLTSRWARPDRAEFRVHAGGSIEGAYDLNGLLQGRLQQDLRNPLTFLVDTDRPAALAVQVRAVATQGARLECRIDAQPAMAVDLPDLDGKNDSGAAEYDRVITFPIPSGAHRVTLDNTGPDWLVLSWLEFRGYSQATTGQ
jgi:hypothetical protein